MLLCQQKSTSPLYSGPHQFSLASSELLVLIKTADCYPICSEADLRRPVVEARVVVVPLQGDLAGQCLSSDPQKVVTPHRVH